MNTLSTLERTILECLETKEKSFIEINLQTGLKKHVCHNLLQSLIFRGLIKTNGQTYQITRDINPNILLELNSLDAKKAESLEMIEAIVNSPADSVFKLKKIAMDSREEKIFLALLSNLETFLSDVHKKNAKNIAVKNRKIIFWGMGEIQDLMNQMTQGV
jgi:hypothetical protein